MADPLNILINSLKLEKCGPDQYLGQSHFPGWNRIYGGQVIAQAIIATSNTVENNHLHSMHGNFLRAGDPSKPVLYTIEPILDGRSFQTRLLRATQDDQTLFVMNASFHKQEEGFDHQDEMGDVPQPEDLPSVAKLLDDYKDKLPQAVINYFSRKLPFEMRPLSITRYVDPKSTNPEQGMWLRLLGGDGSIDSQDFSHEALTHPAMHQAALAYASDFTLLDTALIAHGKILFDPSIMMTSLDHSIWFHRPFEINDWIFYRQRSSNAFGARALCSGQFFDRKGRLIASTAQEGLIRKRTQ